MKNPLTYLVILCIATGCARTNPALIGCETITAVRSDVASPITLTLDYAGAEAILMALEQDALTDADVDSLLRIPGVRAMVDNITRFIPDVGVAQFGPTIQAFVPRKRASEKGFEFQFDHVWRERSNVRGLIEFIRSNESAIVNQTLTLLGPFLPDSTSLNIQVVFVAGGVSDGFVFEDDPSAFHINLARAGGDCMEVVANIVHEAYHVVQASAQQHSANSPVERVMMETLKEGTATFVADPARITTDSNSLRTARDRYSRSAELKRIKENFEVFDRVVQSLEKGTMTWQDASMIGFTRSPENEDRFYFVGYEMAKAIERYCGEACIGKLFDDRPVEFFAHYITLYRNHPEILGRFAPETEDIIFRVMR